jgi:hypothetical protein
LVVVEFELELSVVELLELELLKLELSEFEVVSVELLVVEVVVLPLVEACEPGRTAASATAPAIPETPTADVTALTRDLPRRRPRSG